MKTENKKTKPRQLVTWHYKTEYRNGEAEFHNDPAPPRYDRGAITTKIRNVTFTKDEVSDESRA